MWAEHSDVDSFEAYQDTLVRRPTPINGIALPTVRNIQEAEFICTDFEAVITAGPSEREVDWAHPNHRVWSFHDSDNHYGPGLQQVEEMLAFGIDHDDVLVHCHAGISRSTATAWGIAIAKSADPEVAFRVLMDTHPEEGFTGQRPFSPNRRLVAHLQEILGYPDLLTIRDRVLRENPVAPWWL